MQPRVRARLAQLGERGETGHCRDRIAVERADLGHEVGRPVQPRVERLHDLLPPAHGRQREAAADDLAEGGQVGDDAVVLLGAAVGEAEARHHLVEDQRDPVARGERAQPREEAGLGREEALEGLDDDGGETVGVHGEQRLHRGQIVVGRDEHLGVDDVRDARRVGHGGGEGLGRPRRRAHQRVVVAAVIAALELHHLVALAPGARRAEREERRLRPRRGETHLLGARDGAAQLVGQHDDRLVDHEVGRPVLELVADGGHHRGVAVAEDHGARAEQVVDVLAPAHVPDLRPAAALDHEGELVGEARGPERPAGQAARRQLQQPVLFGRSGSRLVAHWSPRSSVWPCPPRMTRG